MEKKMENEMETREYMRVIILGLYWDNGKSNGNCCSIGLRLGVQVQG